MSLSGPLRLQKDAHTLDTIRTQSTHTHIKLQLRGEVVKRVSGRTLLPSSSPAAGYILLPQASVWPYLAACY